MNKTVILKIIMLILLISFVGLYVTSNTGYFDYEASKKVALTKEQIKIFEKDIKKGKKIDIKEYLNINEKDYDNNISKVTLKISETIGSVFDKSIKFIFKSIEKGINN